MKSPKFGYNPRFGTPVLVYWDALAKQLVELMGGKITLTSTLGVGSAFTVTLPATPS